MFLELISLFPGAVSSELNISHRITDSARRSPFGSAIYYSDKPNKLKQACSLWNN